MEDRHVSKPHRLVAVVAAVPSCFLWLAFGAAIQQVLHNRRRLRIFNIAMGALLALSIVFIVR